MATKYSAIPALPDTGVEQWQAYMLDSIKENVELLNGSRGEDGQASKAITKAQLSVNQPTTQQMTNVTATGAGAAVLTAFTIVNNAVNVTGRANVPVLEDYNSLLINVQQLANDVARLRATVDILISQLKG
tara:strand:- start:34291 stop:34683 length:393 start_codon:yes stop_codon:yes gene_type:complete